MEEHAGVRFRHDCDHLVRCVSDGHADRGGGEVLCLHPLVPDKFRRLLSRSSSFGLNASIEAVLDAGLRIGDEEDEPDADLGIAMGCGLIYPELEEFIEIFEDYFGEGSGRHHTGRQYRLSP